MCMQLLPVYWAQRPAGHYLQLLLVQNGTTSVPAPVGIDCHALQAIPTSWPHSTGPITVEQYLTRNLTDESMDAFNNGLLRTFLAGKFFPVYADTKTGEAELYTVCALSAVLGLIADDSVSAGCDKCVYEGKLDAKS